MFASTSPLLDSDGHVLPGVAEEPAVPVWPAPDPAVPAHHGPGGPLQAGLDPGLSAGQSVQAH